MKASNINICYYTTAEELIIAIDSIENDKDNYDGNWLRGGSDIQLKLGAKAKLAALHKRLDALPNGEV